MSWASSGAILLVSFSLSWLTETKSTEYFCSTVSETAQTPLPFNLPETAVPVVYRPLFNNTVWTVCACGFVETDDAAHSLLTQVHTVLSCSEGL